MPFCHFKLIAEKPKAKAYPLALNTLGDHIRKRRLDLRLLQREVAKVLGVDEGTIYAWEKARNIPSLCQIPKILDFLGYSPFPAPVTWQETIIDYRKRYGISRKRLASQLGVDSSSIKLWESGRRKPYTKSLAKLKEILK